MDPRKRESLEWFVQYAQMDLEQIRPGDKAKLKVEAGEYLFPSDKELDTLLPHSAVDKNFPAAWAFEKLSPEEYWGKILESQGIIRHELSRFIFYEKEEIPYTGVMHRLEMVVSMDRGDETFGLSLVPIAKSLSAYLQFKVYKLFDGVPVSTLNRCPGCKKLFLNFTLREKKYCSRQCLWRVSAENYRKANLEEYQSMMRKIMRKRYAGEKRAKKLLPKPKSKGQE
jgi:hypothetical protein